MSNWAGGVLTAAGRALQAKVEAGTTLNITKIKLGDGTESMSAVDGMTDLVSPKAVLGISSSAASGQTATITGVLSATLLQAGFWCREWGLFANDPDVGEILYMITIDSQPEWLPASTEAAQISATYAMNIAVANATSITVAIDPAGLVDVEMLENFVGVPGRSKAIALGTTGMLENLPAAWYLECTTAGTTGATTPVITSPTVGGTVTDGTVVWTIRKSASTQDLTRYLPLTGGTVTGQLKLENTYPNKIVTIAGTDTSSLFELIIGTERHKSPAISLTGGTSTSPSAGDILLRAAKADSSGSLPYLQLKPDGSLIHSVNGLNNDLGGSAIVAISFGITNYIKNAKGLIIQWGELNPADFSTTDRYNRYILTLPISFETSRYSIITEMSCGAPEDAQYHTNAYNNSKYSAYIYTDCPPSPASVNTRIIWLAIGH